MASNHLGRSSVNTSSDLHLLFESISVGLVAACLNLVVTGIHAQVATIQPVRAQTRAEVGTRLALGTESNMIGNQVVDSWLNPDPFDLFLPSRANGLAVLNVDLEISQTEAFRVLAENTHPSR
jgi:hypothetical protein